MAEQLSNSPTKSAPLRHGISIARGLESVPHSTLYEGRFGRIFRTLEPLEPKTRNDDFKLLSSTMIELKNDEAPGEDERDNKKISSGFTYFGQFIDHDLTFDPNSILQKENDPDALKNFRTPRFDLDSVYGTGPDDSPFLYDATTKKFLIGKNSVNEDDLPRNSIEIALIGDKRNDENLIVSQLQLAFLKFHNKVFDEIGDFEEARRTVRWHYQWIVIQDFLTKIVGNDIVDDVMQADNYKVAHKNGTKTAQIWKDNLKFFNWRNQPFMPVEFSVAAYRFGHSMVRSNYIINEFTNPDDTPGAEELQIFADDPNDDLRGFRMRPKEREIEWHYLLKFDNSPPDKVKELQFSRKIDTKLAFGLTKLPGVPAPNALAQRNLQRSVALGLPSGQAVAQAMGIPDSLILNPDFKKIQTTDGEKYSDLSAADKKTLFDNYSEETPLWYYILHEAETLCDGERLGPVGGRIVAEVFIGILLGDNFSYAKMNPLWKPSKNKFGCVKDGQYRIVDLLRYVGAQE